MHKKIWTVNEEIGNIVFLIFVSIIWYVLILASIKQNGFQPLVVLFIIVGLLFPFQTVRMLQKMVYFRKRHAKCVQEGHPQKGKIVNIVREHIVEPNSKSKNTLTWYFLIIEMFDSNTGMSQRIMSDPYRIPLHKYLGAPYVKVYTDSTGEQYVIDGFQLKENPGEPGITLENPNIYQKDVNGPQIFRKVIAVVFLIWILLLVLGIVRK